MSDVPGRSLTVKEVARRYRVGWQRVKGWIERGELQAVSVRDPGCRKPAFVVTPEALLKFERQRQQAARPVPKPKRRKTLAGVIDFFPDW